MRTLTLAAASLALLAGSSPGLAAPCRGANGKFVKCAKAAPAASVRCKDAKGKFAKCGAPGAHPA